MVLFSVFMWQLLNTPWSIRTQTLKFMELHIMLSTSFPDAAERNSIAVELFRRADSFDYGKAAASRTCI